jgi:hypothetical protein
MIFNQFNEVETPPTEIAGKFMLAGGAPGINAFYGAESTRVVIVLSNYDPPVAMEVGSQILDAPEQVQLRISPLGEVDGRGCC